MSTTRIINLHFFILMVLFFAACSLPGSRHQYVVVHSVRGGSDDTIYYTLVKEPKGVADDTIWELRQREAGYELNDSVVKQSVQIKWVLDHLGGEMITWNMNVDSLGNKFHPMGGMMMNISGDTTVGKFTGEDGKTIPVTTHLLMVDVNSYVRIDIDPSEEYVVLRHVAMGDERTFGILYDKKMPRKTGK